MARSFIERVAIHRYGMLDDLWTDGMLNDTTYVRALVFDGLEPAAASERLAKVKREYVKCSTAESAKEVRSTDYRYTTDYRR